MRTRQYFNSSIDARKSQLKTKGGSHEVKSNIIPFLNILDKCTQILREDRLWIRNELKANNEDLIAIFKSLKKPLNLQHLQIKLRKHIKNVKVQAKMQQINKFKENMNMVELQHETHSKSANKLSHYKLNTNKYQFPSNSVERAKKLDQSINKSIESFDKKLEKAMNQDYAKKCLEKYQGNYDVPMDKITERESENVTSARHRIFNQQLSHYEENKYQRWERPPFERERENFFKHKNNFITEIKRDLEEEPETFSGKRQVKGHEEHRNQQLPMEYKFMNSMDPSLPLSNYSPMKSSQRRNEQSSFNLSSNNRSKDEDIFTSPELLLECRNFINKSKSNNKTNNTPLYSAHQLPSPLQYKPLQFDDFSAYQPKMSATETPMNQIIKNIQNLNSEEPEFKFPAVHEQRPMESSSQYHNYEYFHTFAASNQKDQWKREPIYLCAEDVVDKLMKESVTQDVAFDFLIQVIRSSFPHLEHKATAYFMGSSITIANVGRFLEREQQQKVNRQNNVYSVYCLLDIEKKGYIGEEQIENFLNQFYEAEVENCDEMASLLWRIFDSASELHSEGVRALDYWKLYSIQGSEEFKLLSEMLHEYEFEIDCDEEN